MRTSSSKAHSSVVQLAKLLYEAKSTPASRPTDRSCLRRPTSEPESPSSPRDFQAEMLAIQSVSLVVLLLAVLPMCLSYPSLRVRELERRQCQGCGNECDKCTYGVIVSPICGVLECRKGPNEHCGGRNNMKGVCGEGMLCQCERCTGCSIDNLKCSDQMFDPCRLRDDATSGPWDPLRNSWFTLVR